MIMFLNLLSLPDSLKLYSTVTELTAPQRNMVWKAAVQAENVL